MTIAKGRKDYRIFGEKLGFLSRFVTTSVHVERNEIVETIFVNLATRVQLIV